jgi:hypothetical protein
MLAGAVVSGLRQKDAATLFEQFHGPFGMPGLDRPRGGVAGYRGEPAEVALLSCRCSPCHATRSSRLTAAENRLPLRPHLPSGPRPAPSPMRPGPGS